jgi:beta-galactosidase
VKGLDGEDLRDWRGAGTACPDEWNTNIAPNKRHPNHGWHWGNKGSVATTAVEKPHLSGWRPILECEFDLAYTPLMEAGVGGGTVIWCGLDLEGRTQRDPVAEILTRRLIDYAANRKARTLAPVAYLGNSKGRSLVRRLGVETVDARPGTNLVLVAGPGCTDEQLAPYTELGTPILVLTSGTNHAPFGVHLRKAHKHTGSLKVPDWPECRGLSASELRLRTEIDWWVLNANCRVGAHGLLGRKEVGSSTVIYCRLDPDALDADRRVHNRYTRWRQHRAIANLLANLGAAFSGDAEFVNAVAGSKTRPRPPYHPTYSHDFVSGDDPYRWNTW